MSIVKKFMMLNLAVKDMPKATNFYADLLGLDVTQDYRQDEANWWVTVALPEGGVSITLSTFKGHMEPGTAQIYLTTEDIKETHKVLKEKDSKIGDIQNDLYGPGSNVKFIELTDPDGNKVLLVQE